MSKVEISHLITEKRNPSTMNLDQMTTREFLEVMNNEDAKVAFCVKEQLDQIEIAVHHIIQAFNQGGRLIYVGSGTSGRLGVLDAVECPPTFSTTDEVQGIIAGGPSAFVKAKEGVEDSATQGAYDIETINVNVKDVVVGIAASGRTPHTIGALDKANELGAYTVALACNPNSEIGKHAQLAIEVATGPEVVSGSTRLKAGTAQKMILNMLSTASMIGIGKTYQNLMIDLHPSNQKLVERSIRIVMQACECSYEEALDVFEKSEHKPKYAIIMYLLKCSLEEAKCRLAKEHGFVYKAIQTK